MGKMFLKEHALSLPNDTAALSKDYNTEIAFVFLKAEYNDPDVPPWAIKLILQKDEI